MTRRDFVGTSIAAGLTLGALAQKGMGQQAAPRPADSPKLGSASSRGPRRFIYVSDPSSIAGAYLPFSDDSDAPVTRGSVLAPAGPTTLAGATQGVYGFVDSPKPVTEAALRRWVDELADAQVDTFIQEAYTQGWTTYWRTEGFEYDARPQHRRFLALLDSGVQPLELLLDQAHKRGMEFLAGIRMNDDHGHISIGQGVAAGAAFLANNPQWALTEKHPGSYYKLSHSLNFSFPEVRNYVFSVVEALLGRFQVDGLELCFRDHQYFPHNRGPESQPLMTELVRRIRQALDKKGGSGKRRLQLGARVYETMEECRSQGLDVAAWISEGLLDYVAPGDVMYSTPNALYETFVQPAHRANCQVYPPLQPWSSVRMRRRLAGMPISLDQQRAVVKNILGSGADGFSSYNHFVPIQSAPFYPLMLQDFPELLDPDRIARGNRHYVFEPIWAGSRGFGADGVAPTGALKADRIVLSRTSPGAKGRYRFRISEDFKQVRRALLLFRGGPMTLKDRLEIRLNGVPIAAAKQKRRSDEKRIDMAAGVDVNSRTSAGEPLIPEIPAGPTLTTWFDLTGPPAVDGDNWLEVTLVEADPGIAQDIIIDEIEVFIRPKLA